MNKVKHNRTSTRAPSIKETVEAGAAPAATFDGHHGYALADRQALDVLPERHDLACELMPQRRAGLIVLRADVGHGKVGPADAAAAHFQDDLAWARLRVGDRANLERQAGAAKNGRTHDEGVSGGSMSRRPAAW